MATYSSNTTLRIAGAVSNSINFSGVVYTVPANSYALVYLQLTTSAATNSVTVGSVPVLGSGSSRAPASGTVAIDALHLGPGQVVTLTLATGSATVFISGVLLQNSP